MESKVFSHCMTAEEHLLLETLRFHPEIKTPEELAAVMHADLRAVQMARVRDLIDQLRKKGHSLPF